MGLGNCISEPVQFVLHMNNQEKLSILPDFLDSCRKRNICTERILKKEDKSKTAAVEGMFVLPPPPNSHVEN